MKYHCFFEQSGTFKNEFKKLGFEAFDYDILNDFGETDFVIDLFAEIDKAFENQPSIFDDLGDDDLIFAFFPCTRFECQVHLAFLCNSNNMRFWDDPKKVEYVLPLHNELNEMYQSLCKFFLICYRRNLKMILENPYQAPHYLTRYFPIKPTIIILDRNEWGGDYFKKPTQFWCVNFEPYSNFIFEPLYQVKYNRIDKLKDGGERKGRSLIHPQFANRFIRTYLVKEPAEGDSEK